MKIAINKKYKYITPETVYESDNFEEWVTQERFETHSIIEIPNDVNVEYLRFNQFDYDERTDTFTFNIDKYNQFIELKNTPKPPSTEERLQALELALIDLTLGGM